MLMPSEDITRYMRECDWLVIGSGPSGSMAAKVLSDRGEKDIIVVERLSPGPYSRYHSICGEAVSEKILSKVGFRPDKVLRKVSSISIGFPGGVDVNIPVKGYIIDRNAMLAQLREGTDAERIHSTVSSVRRDGDKFIATIGEEDVRCRYLIGADGAHSVVRRDVFGSKPEEMVPIVNNIVPGDGGDTLRFIVGGQYKGGYRWEFPSVEGTMSVGYPKGMDSVGDVISTGARSMPIGKLPSVVEGNCCLVGDAASIANPLCFGGIGVALLSGRKAVECMISGRPDRYRHWIDHDRMFDRHFMEAHRTFTSWGDEEIEEAMKPFAGGYSIPRGLYAMIRHLSWANIYMSCWLGFAHGW